MSKGAIIFGVGIDATPTDQDLREAQVRYSQGGKNFDSIYGVIVPESYVANGTIENQIRMAYYSQASVDNWETNTISLKIEKFTKQKDGRVKTFYIAYPIIREINVQKWYIMQFSPIPLDAEKRNNLWLAHSSALDREQPNFRLLWEKIGEISPKGRFVLIQENELDAKYHHIWIDWLKTQEPDLPLAVEQGSAWNAFYCNGRIETTSLFIKKSVKVRTLVYFHLSNFTPDHPNITTIVVK